MLNVIIFGAPGAGKGTQSENIIKQYNLHHLSTGDILRAAIKEQTPIGIEAQKHIDKGHLVPDEIVIDLISKVLDQHHDVPGFIFDGFPRTVAQAEKLDQMLAHKGHPISLLLALDVKEEELIARILNRGKTSGRSDDQDESIIRNRIDVYTETTLPVKEHYKKQNKYHKVSGIGTIEEISERVFAEIEKVRK